MTYQEHLRSLTKAERERLALKIAGQTCTSLFTVLYGWGVRSNPTPEKQERISTIIGKPAIELFPKTI